MLTDEQCEQLFNAPFMSTLVRYLMQQSNLTLRVVDRTGHKFRKQPGRYGILPIELDAEGKIKVAYSPFGAFNSKAEAKTAITQFALLSVCCS